MLGGISKGDEEFGYIPYMDRISDYDMFDAFYRATYGISIIDRTWKGEDDSEDEYRRITRSGNAYYNDW